MMIKLRHKYIPVGWYLSMLVKELLQLKMILILNDFMFIRHARKDLEKEATSNQRLRDVLLHLLMLSSRCESDRKLEAGPKEEAWRITRIASTRLQRFYERRLM